MPIKGFAPADEHDTKQDINNVSILSGLMKSLFPAQTVCFLSTHATLSWLLCDILERIVAKQRDNEDDRRGFGVLVLLTRSFPYKETSIESSGSMVTFS